MYTSYISIIVIFIFLNTPLWNKYWNLPNFQVLKVFLGDLRQAEVDFLWVLGGNLLYNIKAQKQTVPQKCCLNITWLTKPVVKHCIFLNLTNLPFHTTLNHFENQKSYTSHDLQWYWNAERLDNQKFLNPNVPARWSKGAKGMEGTVMSQVQEVHDTNNLVTTTNS